MMSNIDETIEDYCSKIEDNADEILNNSQQHSDQVVRQAREFRVVADDLRDEAERANDKYFELRAKYNESIREIEDCYDALEKLATVEEQHEETRNHVTEEHSKTRRWVFGGTALGLAGLGGLLGLSELSEDSPEWDVPYDVLRQDGLEQLAVEMTSSNYDSLNSLGSALNEASDDYRMSALGLKSEFADVGVRENSYEDFTLQQRVQLDDAYDRAKNIATR